MLPDPRTGLPASSVLTHSHDSPPSEIWSRTHARPVSRPRSAPAPRRSLTRGSAEARGSAIRRSAFPRRPSPTLANGATGPVLALAEQSKSQRATPAVPVRTPRTVPPIDGETQDGSDRQPSPNRTIIGRSLVPTIEFTDACAITLRAPWLPKHVRCQASLHPEVFRAQEAPVLPREPCCGAYTDRKPFRL